MLRRFALFTTIGCLLAIGLLHDRILVAITEGYLIDSPGDLNQATHVLIASGDRQIEMAAKWGRSGKTILLLHGIDSRAVQCGAEPPAQQQTITLLNKAGVPESQIQELASESDDMTSVGMLLGNWLQRHPQARLGILVDAMTAGQTQRGIQQKMPPEAASRVIVYPLPPLDFDARHWWRTRSGCKAFYNANISRLFVSSDSEQSSRPEYLSPDAFEAAFRQRLGELGVVLSNEAKQRVPAEIPNELAPSGFTP